MSLAGLIFKFVIFKKINILYNQDKKNNVYHL